MAHLFPLWSILPIIDPWAIYTIEQQNKNPSLSIHLSDDNYQSTFVHLQHDVKILIINVIAFRRFTKDFTKKYNRIKTCFFYL